MQGNKSKGNSWERQNEHANNETPTKKKKSGVTKTFFV
jgi:hypothetical protein